MTLEAAVELRLGQLELSVELRVGGGEVLAVLGPNGAGKSTLLRTLAGLQPVGRGRIVLDGEVLLDSESLPPASVATEDRPLGMLFQDYLLFPHMSVRDNIAFGPRAKGTARTEALGIAEDWVERIGLADYRDSRPSELSGGQSQRVALARALANEPRLLLLDEPLSALDPSTRASTRRDLRRHLSEFEGVTVLVTHDPLDALALADTVMVLETGRVMQSGSLAEVTSRPRTPYVAELLGVNLWRGQAAGRAVTLDGGGATVVIGEHHDGEVLVVVRPRAVTLHRSRPESSARNVWECTVTGLDLLGDHVQVRMSGPLDVTTEVTPAAVAELGLAEGMSVWASVKATALSVYAA